MIELVTHGPKFPPIEHPQATRLGPLTILLLSPMFVLITVAILFGLLGFFVLWLATVGTLTSAIVATDLVQRSAAWLARPPVGTLNHRPGYPGA
jgi:hypothetical protein